MDINTNILLPDNSNYTSVLLQKNTILVLIVTIHAQIDKEMAHVLLIEAHTRSDERKPACLPDPAPDQDFLP